MAVLCFKVTHGGDVFQAVDAAGLEGIGDVEFTVSDVNQAPSCGTGSHTMTLDLVTSVDTPLFTLPCTDSDVNVTLSTLTYAESPVAGQWSLCVFRFDLNVVSL